jgi:hypothetical protein
MFDFFRNIADIFAAILKTASRWADISRSEF